MPSSELDKARQDIDSIDAEILRALSRRMEVVERVARYKAEKGLPVLDERREQVVLDARARMAEDLGLPPDGVRGLYEALMRMSRERQQELLGDMARERAGERSVAAFQGVDGANSHLATVRMLGENISTRHFDSFRDVFRAVESGRAAYGVVPVENSYTGSVLDIYDLLGQHAVHIVGELSMPIQHCLMAKPGARLEDLKVILSHEQALSQCQPFFDEHPELEARPYYNTAGAAKAVSEGDDPAMGALANPYAAKLYGLDILIPEVGASKANTTRFLLLSSRPYTGDDANKALIRFIVGHTPGMLAALLSHFASYGLNMVKIESRPVRDRNFEYAFYGDFEGRNVGPTIRKALDEGATFYREAVVLGTYRK